MKTPCADKVVRVNWLYAIESQVIASIDNFCDDESEQRSQFRKRSKQHFSAENQYYIYPFQTHVSSSLRVSLSSHTRAAQTQAGSIPAACCCRLCCRLLLPPAAAAAGAADALRRYSRLPHSLTVRQCPSVSLLHKLKKSNWTERNIQPTPHVSAVASAAFPSCGTPKTFARRALRFSSTSRKISRRTAW